jgi:hypothetical protein
MNESAYIDLLTRELQNAHLAWILDDAVLGGGIFYPVLGDYGLSQENPEHRKLLRAAITAALREGF